MHEIYVKKSIGQEGVKPYFPTSVIALSVLKFVNRQLDTQTFYIQVFRVWHLHTKQGVFHGEIIL